MNTALIRSELLRLKTVPAPLVGAATVAAASLTLVAVGFAFVPPQHVGELADVLSVPATLAAIVLLVLGALGGTSDFQHRTSDMTFLAQPRRGRVLASRATVYAALGVVVAGLCGAACAAVAQWIAKARELVLPVLPSMLATTSGAVIAGGMCAAMGIGFGYSVRSSVPALLAVFTWTTIGEAMLGTVVPPAFLPIGAVRALAGEPTLTGTPTWVAATTLVAYTALALVAGAYRLRRDIAA